MISLSSDNTQNCFPQGEFALDWRVLEPAGPRARMNIEGSEGKPVRTHHVFLLVLYLTRESIARRLHGLWSLVFGS